jgi:hypothetical protein
MDAKTALRDALLGAGVPASWVRSEDEVEKRAEARQKAASAQQTLAA